MREKLSAICVRIFSVGITFCIAWALVIAIAFVAAFIAGGETAVVLTAFIRRYLMSILYFVGTAMVVTGIVKMYLSGEKAFVFEPKPKEEEK